MVAFLDDDDEWDASKVERCNNFTDVSGLLPNWFGFHQLRINGRKRSEIRPGRRSFALSPSFSDFLILDGFVQTSSVFGPRRVLSTFEFDGSFTPMEDWDWYMKLVANGVEPRFLPEVLGTHWADVRPDRLSSTVDPGTAARWLVSHPGQLSSRSKAGFKLLRLAPAQKKSHPLKARLLACVALGRLLGDWSLVLRPFAALQAPARLLAGYAAQHEPSP
jgi:hypothetical protein